MSLTFGNSKFEKGIEFFFTRSIKIQLFYFRTKESFLGREQQGEFALLQLNIFTIFMGRFHKYEKSRELNKENIIPQSSGEFDQGGDPEL